MLMWQAILAGWLAGYVLFVVEYSLREDTDVLFVGSLFHALTTVAAVVAIIAALVLWAANIIGGGWVVLVILAAAAAAAGAFVASYTWPVIAELGAFAGGL